MCLIATHCLPKISFKPIKVYKRLEPTEVGWCTPFMFNKIAFRGGRAVLKASTPWHTDLFYRIIEGRGVHAYVKIRLSSYRAGFYIFEAEIPPFTPYWTGEDGDIAASKLIIYDKLVRL